MANRNWLQNGLLTGLAGAAATSAALAALGKTRENNAWTPFNAIAHMLFGSDAARVEGFAPKETLSGLGLNTSAVGTWGVLYEKIAGNVAFPQSLGAGAAAAFLIYVFDYKVVPERLRPGFEKRLGNEGIVAVYVLLALSLGLSPLWKQTESESR